MSTGVRTGVRRQALTSLLLLLFVAQAHAGFKCWVNHEGVRECGNAVPPEFAQKRTVTINGQGLTVDVRERAPTADEVAEMRERERQEKERLREEERRRKAQDAYDRVLLASFTTERDLLMSRDQKLAAVDANMELTRITIDKLKEDLADLTKKAADFERARRPIPTDLQEDLDRTNHQIDEKMAHISTQEERREAFEEEYRGYIERFRYLKTPPHLRSERDASELTPERVPVD